MHASGYESLPILEMMLGKIISRIRIVTFIYRGGFENDKGDLDLLCEDLSVFRFSSCDGGDLLTVSTEPWVDPYGNFLENKIPLDVSRYGRIGIIDVSENYPYSNLKGKEIVSVHPLISQFNLIAGCYLQLEVGVLCFMTQADEKFIYLEDVNHNMNKLGFKFFNKT
ncbi:MAG: hypothetical protein OHK0022_33990 [Roseiflexaceae bacterium]